MKHRTYTKDKRSIVEGSRKDVNRDLREFVKVSGSGYDVSLTCKALVLIFGASRVNPLELIREV